MNDKVHYIRERFPDHNHRIDLLMAVDTEFLALSEDYDTCVNALRHWVGSQEPEAKTRADEYRILVRELEEEITQVLEGPQPRRLD
jgi:hypothetical protein